MATTRVHAKSIDVPATQGERATRLVIEAGTGVTLTSATVDGVCTLTVQASGGGTSDHALLTNLPWLSSGHTGTDGYVAGFSGGASSLWQVDTDGTLAGNSDSRLASQKAIKTYVDNAVTGLWDLKGTRDCSANPNYPAAAKGDAYVVSVAGKIGGVSGTTVDQGDVFVAIADNAGGTSGAVGTSWTIIQANLVAALKSGDAAGGQLGGTFPNPDVRGLRETSGPTNMTMGAVADGQLLKRSGTTIVGTFVLMAVVATQVINEVASVGTANNTRSASVAQTGTLV
jgi:hypothetical protein